MRRFLIFAGVGVLCVLLAQAGPLAVLVFDVNTAQPGRLPDGWRLKVNRGTPEVNVLEESGARVLRLKSVKSSFGVERRVDVDPRQTPYLTWKWKVTDLPRGGDFRRASTDDQAAQLLVAFNDRRVLTYIWDSSAPKGTMQPASNIPFVHIFAVVCRSGAAEVNRWIGESRNVFDDYLKAYGREPGKVEGIRLQINSQHTGTSAESYFGEVGFRNTPQ